MCVAQKGIKLHFYILAEKKNFTLPPQKFIPTWLSFISTKCYVQGVPLPFLTFQDLKVRNNVHTYDPMMEKPKCVWDVDIYLDFSAVCLQLSK